MLLFPEVLLDNSVTRVLGLRRRDRVSGNRMAGLKALSETTDRGK